MAVLEIAGLIVLVLLGLIVLMMVGTFLFLLPAIVVAVIVWFITGSNLLTGVAFLAVALLSLIKR